MSEHTRNDEQDTPQPQRVVVRRKKKTASTRFWDDPVVRVLSAVIALVIVGALLTVLFAIINGQISLTPLPQDASSAALERARATLKSDPTAENYAAVIIGLGQMGRFDEAYRLLDEARGRAQEFEEEIVRTQALQYAYGYVLALEGRDDEAIETLTGVMTDLMNAYEARLAGDEELNWALAFGVPRNYFNSALALASLYERGGLDSEALKMLDIFLEDTPTASDILAQRGNVKVRLGDTAGARQDFTEALRFDPNNLEAQNGLAQVGEQ